MNMTIKHIYLFLLSLSFVFASCSKDEGLDTNLLDGLWKQESVTEDGQAMALSHEDQNLQLLVEMNGVYRTFTTDNAGNALEHYGSWTTTDDKWLDLTIDTWSVKSQPTAADKPGTWGMNHLHTRFTILSLTNDVMKIRIKTYVGMKKYSALFAEQNRPEASLENMTKIDSEFQTLKTYIFTFKKQ